MPGLPQCTCDEGFYRAASGEEDLPCTSKSSPCVKFTLCTVSTRCGGRPNTCTYTAIIMLKVVYEQVFLVEVAACLVCIDGQN